MYTLGLTVSFCAFFLYGLIVLRGRRTRLYRQYPLFYSYCVYVFFGSLGMYIIYWQLPNVYASGYWIYYLITILVEFIILAEISDQIFQPFPVIHKLGRVLTIVISLALGLVYMLPVVFWSTHRRPALLDFALRACVTKAIILAVLLYVARHYSFELGRNVAGLMLGFSIYLAINIVLMSVGKAFSPDLSAYILWVMEPLASAICVLVWTISLWDLAPMPSLRTTSPATRTDSEAVALELTRFNSELSKLLHK